MQSVGQTADPQTEAAIRIVTWASRVILQLTGCCRRSVAYCSWSGDQRMSTIHTETIGWGPHWTLEDQDFRAKLQREVFRETASQDVEQWNKNSVAATHLDPAIM